MTMVHGWILLASLACLVFAGAEPVRAHETQPECDSAAVMIERWGASSSGPPKVLIADVRLRTTLSAERMATPPTATPRVFGWRTTAPSRAAADTYVGAVNTLPAVETCPGLRELAESLGVAVWTQDEAWKQHSWDETGLGSHQWFYLETPVISPTGDEALAQFGHSCGLDCGSAGLYFLRRRVDGQWEIADEAGISIS
jgi:hypothetical protein